MIVNGEDAKNHKAVRFDSLEDVNQGELIEADDETGRVSWKDKTGETKSVTLGAHTIRIMSSRR